MYPNALHRGRSDGGGCRAGRYGVDDDDCVRWGCGPRAGQGLLLAAKSNAGLSGRTVTTIEDVKKFVHPVLRHRMGLNFAAVSEGQKTDDIVDMLLEAVPDVASAPVAVEA